MKQLQPQSTPVSLAANQSSLPYPPVPATVAFVGSVFNGPNGAVPEFDLALWARAANAVTGAVVYAGKGHAFTFTPDTIESVAANALTLTGHVFKDGDGPVRFTTTGTLPAGLELDTDYWLGVDDANTVKVYASLADVYAGSFVVISDAGSGTHTVEESPNGAKRIYWHALDNLGLAADGAVSLDVDKGYVKRLPHSLGVVAYSVSATTPQPVWGEVVAVQDQLGYK